MWNKIKDSKGLYIAISVFCAVILWMYVDNVVKPDVQITIHNKHVTLVGEDELEAENLMIADEEDLTVTLTFTGSRSVISQINRNNITVQVDVASQISEAGEAELEYTVILPSNISANSVKIKSRTPETITVTVLKTASKTIDVEGEFTGSVAEGYLSDSNSFQFSVDQITIEGEATLVDSVDHAVVTLNENNLTDTWTGTLAITLVDEDGEAVSSESITLSEEEVDVTFLVSAIKEVPLVVELQEGGGATEDNVTCTISPETITVAGTKEVLDGLTEISLGTIDLSQVITSVQETFTIVMPDGVTNLSDETSASVLVKINDDLTTERIEITDIELENVPEGYTATVTSESVTVRIRGAEDSMALVVEDDISIVADLSQLEEVAAGTYTVEATVEIQGFSDVGVIGTYTVTVELS